MISVIFWTANADVTRWSTRPCWGGQIIQSLSYSLNTPNQYFIPARPNWSYNCRSRAMIPIAVVMAQYALEIYLSVDGLNSMSHTRMKIHIVR